MPSEEMVDVMRCLPVLFNTLSLHDAFDDEEEEEDSLTHGSMYIDERLLLIVDRLMRTRRERDSARADRGERSSRASRC